MIMDFLTWVVSSFLDWVLNTLKGLFAKIDFTPFTEKWNYLIGLIDVLNVMFPIKELLQVFGILMTFAFFALVFWLVQKLVTLIRG